MAWDRPTGLEKHTITASQISRKQKLQFVSTGTSLYLISRTVAELSETFPTQGGQRRRDRRPLGAMLHDIRLQLSFGDETALVYLWQVVEGAR